MTFLRRLKFAKDVALMLARFSKLIFNPQDISPIFKGGAFRDARAFKIALAELHADPDTHRLITARYLAKAPYDFEALGRLPEGTLGREYVDFMGQYCLSRDVFPKAIEDGAWDDDINYMRLRARQTHDLHHLVLGIPPTAPGEMMISAFYVAQAKIPLSTLLIAFGFLRTLFKNPDRIDDLIIAISEGWRLGKRTKMVFGVVYEDYFEKPIAEVRELLGVSLPAQDPHFPMDALRDIDQPALQAA